MKKIPLVLIISLCLFSFNPKFSSAHDGSGIIAAFLFPSLYENESAFTLIPASIGSLAFTIPAYIFGGTAYVFGYALGHPFGKSKEFSSVTVMYTGIGVLRIGGYTAGAPFYILEKAFYDAPNALFFGEEINQSNISQKIIKEHPKANNKIEKNQKKSGNTKPSTIAKIQPLDPSTIKCPPLVKTYVKNGETKVEIYSGNSGFQHYECFNREKALVEKMKRITSH